MEHNHATDRVMAGSKPGKRTLDIDPKVIKSAVSDVSVSIILRII